MAESITTRFLGDTLSLLLTCIDPATGGAFNPTGCVMIFTVKASKADADSAAIVQKISTVGGITITDGPNGAVTVELVPADSELFTPDKLYYYDLQTQNATSGAVYTVASGRLCVMQDVTRGTTLSIPTTTTNPGVGYTWANIPDKPSTFAPSAHAASHAANGPDAVSPASIGAETPAGAQSKADAAQSAAISSAASSLSSALGALIERVSDVTNSSGDTTLTLKTGQKVIAAVVTFSGAAGTRKVILSNTNAGSDSLALLRFVFPATAGIVCELRSASAGGTLLASVTSDGTAGTVGVITTHGASQWDEPTQAAWLD